MLVATPSVSKVLVEKDEMVVKGGNVRAEADSHEPTEQGHPSLKNSHGKGQT